MKLALGYGAVFILTFLIVFTDRHNTWCEYSQSFYLFCQWNAKIHSQKSENSTHLLPEAVRLVSSFEGAVKYYDTCMFTGNWVRCSTYTWTQQNSSLHSLPVAFALSTLSLRTGLKNKMAAAVVVKKCVKSFKYRKAVNFTRAGIIYFCFRFLLFFSVCSKAVTVAHWLNKLFLTATVIWSLLPM